MSDKYKRVFTPVKIGSMEVPNRIVLPAMGTNLTETDGSVGQRIIDYYGARAKGGVGLITIEYTAVTPKGGRAIPICFQLNDGKYIPALSELADKVHSYGSKISIQLSHAGRQSLLESNSGELPLAPSPIPCPLCSAIDSGIIPRELTVQEIEDIVEHFGRAALRARAAGIDAIEIHGGHGYLVSQFLSPLTNIRQDAYGGSFEKRMLFPLQVIAEIKKMVGEDFPIIFRLNGDDQIQGGITIEDSKQIAVKLEEAGVSALSVTSGMYGSFSWTVGPIYHPQKLLIHLSSAIKQVVSIPVIGVGRIPNLSFAEDILAKNQADMVALGRPLIADPDLVEKSRNGCEEDIRPCIYCNSCTGDRVLLSKRLRCAVNTKAGREAETELKPASVSKKVLVVGGGPAGMQAATIAARRGHQVTLVDKDDKLGGQLWVASVPTNKPELESLMDYLAKQVEKAGVKIKLGTAIKADEILKMKPDVVIIATGASSFVAKLPGIESALTAIDVLKGEKEVGDRVIVCGGGMVGCDTALNLVKKGKNVVLLELLNEIASDIEIGTKMAIMEKMAKEERVTVLTGQRITAMSSKGVDVEDQKGHKQFIEGDSIALAMGMKPNRELAETLAGKIKEFYVIGDCVQPRRLYNAIHEAAAVAERI